MSANIPAHIQQQFLSDIQELHDNVGQEAAKAYLKSLCTNASLDILFGANHRSINHSEKQPTSLPFQIDEDIWKTFTFLDEDLMTDYIDRSDTGHRSLTHTRPYSSLTVDGLEDGLLALPSHNAVISGPVTPPSEPNLETSTPFSLYSASAESKPTTPCEACTCERCTERKSRQKRAEGHNNSPDTVMRGFLRPRLLGFLSEYWETLKVNGLYHHESAQTFQWAVDNSPVHVRRLYYHLILDHLGTENDLYLWRRSIAEINNLNSYRGFFAETEGEMKRKKPTRRTGETNSQKTHKEYLAYIYADRSPKDFDKAKQSLKTNLEFRRRWSILVEDFVGEGDLVVPGLSLGAFLLCGPSIRKKMSIPVLLEDYSLTKV